MKQNTLKRDSLILVVLIAVAVVMLVLRDNSKPSLELKLYAQHSSYTPGDSIRFFATLTNCSDSSVVMVLPQPGSAQCMRFPYCSLRITDPQGNRLDMPHTTSILPPPLQSQHIITMEPGDSLQLYPDGIKLPYQLTKTGTYQATMVYRTDSKHERLWHGPYTHQQWIDRSKQEFWQARERETKKVGRLLHKVPPVQLHSEPIEISVI